MSTYLQEKATCLMNNMARLEPKFILDKPKSKIETCIFLQISLPGRFRISTKEKILPELWESNTQRPTGDKKTLRTLSPFDNKRIKYLSACLDEIEYQIKDLILELKRDKRLLPEVLKKEINKIIGKEEKITEKPVQRISVIEYYDKVIEKMKSHQLLTPKGTPYTTGTIRAHNTGKRYIAYYEQVYGTLYFESINAEFKIQFIGIMNEKMFKMNTISRAVSFVKFICGQAFDEGIHTNTYYQSPDFDIDEEDVDNIYLTSDELKTLFAIDKFQIPGHEIARDLFLIGCYTALRYSDYSRIKPQYIHTTENGTKIIDMVTQKTKERVIIPFLFPELDILLAKYDYSSPKLSAQKLNEYIKVVAKSANINQEVIINETIGGSHQEKIYKKHELITSHTARRTGATNLFKLGFAPLEIMKITGHTSEKTFMKYIKISKIENADRMAEKASLF